MLADVGNLFPAFQFALYAQGSSTFMCLTLYFKTIWHSSDPFESNFPVESHSMNNSMIQKNVLIAHEMLSYQN